MSMPSRRGTASVRSSGKATVARSPEPERAIADLARSITRPKSRTSLRPSRPVALLALTCAVALAVTSRPASQSLPAPPGATLVSIALDGSKTSGGSGAISDDGRYVAFESTSSTLVVADANSAADIFLRDLTLQQTRRVSVSSDGVEGNADSSAPALSGDGRVVAFVSSASNLVPADTNGVPDIFVYDRVTGRTERVSVSSSGAQADGASADPALSADGRYVVFTSSATTLVAGDRNVACDANCDNVLENCSDVFLHDRATGRTQLVSVALGADLATVQASGPRSAPMGGWWRSGRGRATWWPTTLRDFPAPYCPLDPWLGDDLFTADLATGDVTRVSLDEMGEPIAGTLGRPVLSASGRWVGFSARVSDPVAGHLGWSVRYVHDRSAASTRELGRSKFYQGYATIASVIGDGRLVLVGNHIFRGGFSNMFLSDLRSGASWSPVSWVRAASPTAA